MFFIIFIKLRGVNCDSDGQTRGEINFIFIY